MHYGSFLRKITPLVLVVLALSVAVLPQDAPTIQQCRADVAMWRPELPQKETYFAALSMSELNHRHTVLLQCGLVAASQRTGNMVNLSESIEIGQWADLQELYCEHEAMRTLAYLKRHGLLDQFWKEDAAGQR